MDEIIEGLIAKTGISKEQAEAVLTFLKENGPKVIELLGNDTVAGVADKLPGGLGGALGGLLGGGED
jgi:hypothetical protein